MVTMLLPCVACLLLLAPAPAAAAAAEEDLDLGLAEELDLLGVGEEELFGVVARRRPLTARSYQHAAQAQGAFGMDMFQVLVDRDNSTNVVFSPMSVGTALAMIFAGSRGQTAGQLSAALHLQGAKRDVMHSHRRLVRHTRKHSQNGLTVAITSNLYMSATVPLKPKFPQYATNMFGASVTPLLFEIPELAAEVINEQVRNDTQGIIDDIVHPDMFGPSTRFVLANAVYFKGGWLMKFDANDTVPGQFHTATGPRPVNMMSAKKEFPVANLPELDARALLMPYQGEDLGMMILLPNKVDGIYELERHLNMSTLSSAQQRLDTLAEVQVQLPKFEMNADLDLEPILMELGVFDLFSPTRADLRGITGARDTALNAAVHKAFISVSEEGTEAAATTMFACCWRSAPPKIPPFIVDRPFLFVIMEMKATAVLFVGRVLSLGE